MPDNCKRCMRPKGAPHHFGKICDTVRLSDNRVVQRSRIELGGDLHDKLGDDLQVVQRNITPEMREKMEAA